MSRIVLAALLLLPVSLGAQWLDWRTRGIPRTADGKPDLAAPAPKTSDGTPDLSGVWAALPNPYRLSLTQDLEDEATFRPAARALFDRRLANFRHDDPVTNCLPGGPADMLSATYRIMQSREVIAVLYENNTGRFRQIHLDGRTLPADPNPTWLGYSVGRWEGDTLVVESAGFNDRTWLDRAGHPHSDKLRVTERFRRVDFGHVDYRITFDDPETMTKPLSLTLPVQYQADGDMLENVCSENSRSRLVGVAPAGVHVDAAVLARYQGQYAFTGGSRTVAGFMGMKHKVRLVNGRLYLDALPLIPLSATMFESTGATAEFSLDASGRVTRMVLGQTEGEAIYTPER